MTTAYKAALPTHLKNSTVSERDHIIYLPPEKFTDWVERGGEEMGVSGESDFTYHASDHLRKIGEVDAANELASVQKSREWYDILEETQRRRLARNNSEEKNFSLQGSGIEVKCG
jgi:hypothetical protein